jgi:hypothetical protein
VLGCWIRSVFSGWGGLGGSGECECVDGIAVEGYLVRGRFRRRGERRG